MDDSGEMQITFENFQFAHLRNFFPVIPQNIGRIVWLNAFQNGEASVRKAKRHVVIESAFADDQLCHTVLLDFLKTSLRTLSVGWILQAGNFLAHFR